MKIMNIRRSLLLLVAMLMLAAMLAGCGEAQTNEPQSNPDSTHAPAAAPAEPLVMEQRSLLLASGEEAKLSVTGGDEITYESSDADVASVDANGNVKALKKGNAIITVSSGEQKVYCGVMVDPAGEMLDVASMQSSVVLSDVQLYHPMEIIGFGVDTANNAYYFSQQYGTSAYRNLVADSMLTKVEQVNGVWQRTEYMHLYNHGYGYFSLETEGNEVYLLTESNGEMATGGTTISRVKWENEKMCEEEFGDVYALSELTGYFRPQTDVENDILAIYAFNGRESYYAIYDRDGFLSGEQPQYLRTVSCARGQQPAIGEDASGGAYNSSIRGFAIRDGYIYQLSGSATMYLSVFDMDGKLQYCTQIVPIEGAANAKGCSLAFDEDGSLYLAVNTSDSADLFYANVWKLEEVKNDENNQ